MILTTMFLSGCGRSDMAALQDHGNSFYGQHGVTQLANAFNAATVQAAPSMSVSSNNLGAPQSSQAYGQTTLQNTSNAPFARAANWQWPVQGNITEKFGQQAADGVSNEGIVIAASEGTPIRAASGGEVAFVGEDAKNYGNIVILRHASGEMTSYSHAREIIVKKGDRVPAGKIIAYVGKTGNAKQPELHFAVRDGSKSVDPLLKLPQQMAAN